MTTTRRVPAPGTTGTTGTAGTTDPSVPEAARADGAPSGEGAAPAAEEPPGGGASRRRGPLPLLRRAPGAPPAVVAHRGSSSTAPENTLAAFEAARRAGAPWVETDLRRTRDGVAVVIHDAGLDRTTDGAGELAGATAAEVAALDAGSWFAPGFCGARVPLLAELLAWAAAHRGPHLLLELKGSWTAAEVAPVVAAVHEHGLADRVLLQSFDVGTVAACADGAADLAVGLLVRAGGRVPLLGAPAADGAPVHEGVARLVAEHGLSAVNPEVALVLADPGVVRRLHRLGVAVWVWTVDDAADWAALEEAGVDGIITNRPDRMLGWVEGRRARVPEPRRGPRPPEGSAPEGGPPAGAPLEVADAADVGAVLRD